MDSSGSNNEHNTVVANLIRWADPYNARTSTASNDHSLSTSNHSVLMPQSDDHTFSPIPPNVSGVNGLPAVDSCSSTVNAPEGYCGSSEWNLSHMELPHRMSILEDRLRSTYDWSKHVDQRIASIEETPKSSEALDGLARRVFGLENKSLGEHTSLMEMERRLEKLEEIQPRLESLANRVQSIEDHMPGVIKIIQMEATLNERIPVIEQFLRTHSTTLDHLRHRVNGIEAGNPWPRIGELGTEVDILKRKRNTQNLKVNLDALNDHLRALEVGVKHDPKEIRNSENSNTGMRELCQCHECRLVQVETEVGTVTRTTNIGFGETINKVNDLITKFARLNRENTSLRAEITSFRIALDVIKVREEAQATMCLAEKVENVRRRLKKTDAHNESRRTLEVPKLQMRHQNVGSGLFESLQANTYDHERNVQFMPERGFIGAVEGQSNMDEPQVDESDIEIYANGLMESRTNATGSTRAELGNDYLSSMGQNQVARHIDATYDNQNARS